MSHYEGINPRVFFAKELQQYLVYKDFHQLHLSLAKALKQLKTMGILEDLTITFSQMLEWAQPLDGIKDHCKTSTETTNAYDADYKMKCTFRGANFVHAVQLKRSENRLELARNEASDERVTALVIEIDAMKADKIVLEAQTAEQLREEKEMKEAAAAAQEEHAWQRKKEQEEHARQRKKEQEEQAPKA
jgi:hypothetical protein